MHAKTVKTVYLVVLTLFLLPSKFHLNLSSGSKVIANFVLDCAAQAENSPTLYILVFFLCLGAGYFFIIKPNTLEKNLACCMCTVQCIWMNLACSCVWVWFSGLSNLVVCATLPFVNLSIFAFSMTAHTLLLLCKVFKLAVWPLLIQVNHLL